MELIKLPKNIQETLTELNAHERLIKHLQIVHSTAFEILSVLTDKFPSLEIDEKLVLFGASVHDIGKTEILNELFEGGNEHEIIGVKVLKKLEYNEEQSRFAFTHGNWDGKNITLEDLIVSLADNLWCGRRVEQLEELAIKKIAKLLMIDFWDVYHELTSIFDDISFKADQRLEWQK